jgi:hypothetical protein
MGAHSAHHPFVAIELVENTSLRLNITKVCSFLVPNDLHTLIEVDIDLLPLNALDFR